MPTLTLSKQDFKKRIDTLRERVETDFKLIMDNPLAGYDLLPEYLVYLSEYNKLSNALDEYSKNSKIKNFTVDDDDNLQYDIENLKKSDDFIKKVPKDKDKIIKFIKDPYSFDLEYFLSYSDDEVDLESSNFEEPISEDEDSVDYDERDDILKKLDNLDTGNVNSEYLEDELKNEGPNEAPTKNDLEINPELGTAKNYIEQMKRQIGKLPSNNPSIKDKNDLKDYVKSIMASRMDVGSVRGNKKTLETERDLQNQEKARNYLDNHESVKNWLNSMSYNDLYKLATKRGHGGKLEDSYVKYLSEQPTLPKDIDPRYIPTAKQRTEALQKQIKSLMDGHVTQASVEKLSKSFKELMVARSCAKVQRKGAGLNNKIDMAEYNKFQEKINENKEPSFVTIDKFINLAYKNRDIGAQQLLREALEGHGGKFQARINDVTKKRLAEKKNQAPVMGG
ncbi:MAG: hypothetical protein K5894_09845 [Lachnospiraceae bacterium]|nr:hypothetical protein [Lachnospiraceae bacterium]